MRELDTTIATLAPRLDGQAQFQPLDYIGGLAAALAIAVCKAGGLGSLPCAMLVRPMASRRAWLHLPNDFSGNAIDADASTRTSVESVARSLVMRR